MPSMQVELMPLATPAFTTIKRPPGRREDGIFPDQAAGKVYLNDLPRETVLQLLEEMQRNVLATWDMANSLGTAPNTHNWRES